MDKSLEQIETFWNDNLCGNHFVNAPYPSREFFEEYRTFRYKKTHHLNSYIDWASAKGRDVLEVGLGIGADGTRWAKHASTYTGVDLTDEAVHATNKHLQLLGLDKTGKAVKGNAEKLQFDDAQFDIVYSHGVLHHTDNIKITFNEINRVLKKDGQFIVMLYAKQSFNYWLRIQVWFRVRFLIALILNLFNINQSDLWKNHVRNFKKKGWAYFSWNDWPHHCTDGPDCDVANIYTRKEVKKMLSEAGFKVQEMKQAHFPAGLSEKTEQKLASFMGFHLITWAKK